MLGRPFHQLENNLTHCFNYSLVILIRDNFHVFSRDIRLGAKQVVRMYGNETIITSKDGIVHRFYYDHCFWSFDSRHTDYADQEKVYKELAQPLLDRSFEGYNTCLFAYGQVSREKRGREGGRGREEDLDHPLSPHRLDQENHTGELNVSLRLPWLHTCIMGEGESLGVVPQFSREL